MTVKFWSRSINVRGVARDFIMLKPTKKWRIKSWFTFQIANNKGADQTVWMRRLVCAFVIHRFPMSRPLWCWSPGFLASTWLRAWILSTYHPANILLTLCDISRDKTRKEFTSNNVQICQQHLYSLTWAIAVLKHKYGYGWDSDKKLDLLPY